MINQGNNVPDKTIAVFPYDGYSFDQMSNNIHSLSGVRKREWFDKHFYNCLPLTIGNQYGIAVRSAFTFEATWPGGEAPAVITFEPNFDIPQQVVSTHFNNGVITFQNFFALKTPPGIRILETSLKY